MSKWGEVINEIPDGFIDRASSPDDEYYPDRINDHTLVEVVLLNKQNGHLILCKGQAGCFGWAKQPANPCCPGLTPMDVPITHYRILEA